MIVVANKAMPNIQEVSRKDFEHSIERKIDVLIPLDPKSAMQAAKLGQPLAKSTKSSKITGPLMQLLTLTLEQAATEEEGRGGAKASGSSLLGRFNFKALVAKKPKEVPAQAA